MDRCSQVCVCVCVCGWVGGYVCVVRVYGCACVSGCGCVWVWVRTGRGGCVDALFCKVS